MTARVHKIRIKRDDYEHRLLLAVAKAQRKSLSALLREAVVVRLLKEARRTSRRETFKGIASMELPVADWSEMEREIEGIHIETEAPSAQ